MKKDKKEFRYQFLGYEDVGTGKYEETPFGVGLIGSGVGHYKIEIKKQVAVVFDKELGIVKQTEIKKL